MVMMMLEPGTPKKHAKTPRNTARDWRSSAIVEASRPLPLTVRVNCVLAATVGDALADTEMLNGAPDAVPVGAPDAVPEAVPVAVCVVKGVAAPLRVGRELPLFVPVTAADGLSLPVD
jgi:hypothetical protein